MSGNAVGALKAAATKAGVPLDVYIARRTSGDLYCSGCRAWKRLPCFYSTRRSRCKECLTVGARQPGRMSDREVAVLRELRWVGGIPYSALSKMFGRSHHAVWSACNGLTRARLPMPSEQRR